MGNEDGAQGQDAMPAGRQSKRSIRPVPVMYDPEPDDFQTKREANRPRRVHYPRPPAKNVSMRVMHSHAKRVSFREQNESMSSLYDTSKAEPYFKQVFDVKEKIGEGSFAEVFRARDKEKGVYYAVKQSHKFRKSLDRTRQIEEAKRHEAIPPHPNCVRFISAWEEGDRMYLQTELCKLSLQDYCEQNRAIPESLVWNYLVDLLRALKHLHDRDLIHLDVKPENIFISESGILKLGDFGSVHDLKSGEGGLQPEAGEGKYLAPEVLSGDQFSKAADVFSLGITILEIAVDLDVPATGSLFENLRSLENQRLPDELMERFGLSDDLVGIIRCMLMPDPARRPSVDDLLALPAVRRVARKRKLYVSFYDWVDRIRSQKSYVASHLSSWLLYVFWLVVSLLVWPVAWLRGSERRRLLSSSSSGMDDSGTGDEREMSSVVNLNVTGVDAGEPGENGTPPNIRGTSVNPSPVLKPRTARASDIVYSPRSPAGSGFTSTPIKQNIREASSNIRTPQLTPLSKRATPTTQGSASALRRLNFDNQPPVAASTPHEPGPSGTARKKPPQAFMGRNLFAYGPGGNGALESPADISADEDEAGDFVARDRSFDNSGSPVLKSNPPANELAMEVMLRRRKLTPRGGRLVASGKKTSKSQTNKHFSSAGNPVSGSGDGDHGIVRDLSRQFGALSDTE